MLDVGVTVIVSLPVDVPLEVIDDDIEIESVPLKLDPRVGEDDGVFDMLVEKLIVLVKVVMAEGELEPVPLLNGDVNGEGTAHGVALALPPKEIVEVDDGDKLKVEDVVWLLEGVIEVVEIAVKVSEPVLEVVDVTVASALIVVDAVLESELVGVTVASAVTVVEAVLESELVGVGVDEDDKLCVVEVVSALEGVCVSVDVSVTVPDTVLDSVGVGVNVSLSLLVVEAVLESELVGVGEDEDDKLCVDEVVSALEGVCVSVDVSVTVPDTVPDNVGVGVNVSLLLLVVEAVLE